MKTIRIACGNFLVLWSIVFAYSIMLSGCGSIPRPQTNTSITPDRKWSILASDTEKSGEYENASSTLEYAWVFGQQQSPAIITIGDESIKIHYGEKTIYIIDPERKSVYRDDLADVFPTRLPIEHRGRPAIKNKYVKIANQTITVRLVSKTPDVLLASEKNNFIAPKKAGYGQITVYVDGHSVDIILKVVKIPLTKGMSDEEVIQSFGLPDARTTRHIAWPKSETVDGIYYSTIHSIFTSRLHRTLGYTVEHWFYDQYPGVIFHINNGFLRRVIQKRWYELKYKSID